mmetsp:Transcript_48004/g.80639  ORF Transcript_48004/g.80639 Transcript_48004/m.80639 type:complete len:223 (+) Transcript_48004:754-1422(+)
MDAQPQLHFVGTEAIRGWLAGQRAHRQPHSHGPDGARHVLSLSRHLVQRAAGGSGCPCNLVDESGSRKATTTGCTPLIQGAVFPNNDHAHVVPFCTSLLCRKPKVDAVAGVVLHDQQAAGGAGHHAQCREDLGYARGGEHTPGSHCRQHPCPNVSGMCRLMARSSAAQQGHLCRFDLLVVTPNQCIHSLQSCHTGMKGQYPLKHLLNKVRGVVNETLRHGAD